MSRTRVDFYLVDTNRQDEIMNVVCKLTEKAYFRKHQVFIFCNNQQQAETVDEMLWSFRDDSFVPHNIQGEGPTPPPPIQIGYNDAPRRFNDILINLADTVPNFYQQFGRVLQVVSSEEKN